MVKVVVNKERCKGCGLCVEVCPKGVLKMSNSFNKMGYHFVEVVDESKCMGCKNCVTICPDVVIELYKIEEKINKEVR